MEHDGCKLCKYENCSMESKECMGCKQNAVDKYKRMTQADRIRSFSDDELAEFIEQVSTDSMETISFGTKEYEEIWEHKETALQWLQSEVEIQSMKWLIRKLLKQVVKLYFFVDKECYCLCLGSKNPKYDYTVTKNIYPD